MIYDHKDKETLTKYEVKAFPTFVVTDAEGKELMRQVGAPFSTPKDAREWFPQVADALDGIDDLEAKYKENPDNLETGIELAETYAVLGKGDKAVELYATLAEKIPAEHEKHVDVKLGYADALRGTLSRSNQDEVGKQISEIYDAVLPDLIKDADDRAIDPAVLNARIKAIVNKDTAAARKQLKNMVKPYAEHERILEIKYWAAIFARENNEKDVARAELEAIIEEGDEDDRWVESAKKALEALDKKEE